MEIGFVEPCCVERQLPALLREYPMAAFQTNSDVTFLGMMKAVSCMAGNHLDITLMVPEVDVDMLRVLGWYDRRGWLNTATLLTAKLQTELINSELTPSKVKTYHHEMVTDSMVVISGEAGMVVVQGALLSKATSGFRCYTAAFGKSSSPVIQMCTATLRSLVNKRTADFPCVDNKAKKKKGKKETAGNSGDPAVPEPSKVESPQQ